MTRRLLRQERRDCATWCRTTCSSSWRLVAMEPPAALDAISIRDEKVKVFKSIRPIRARACRSVSPCAGNTAPANIATASRPTRVPKEKTSRQIRRRKLSLRSSSTSTTGAGAAMPFYLRTGKFLTEEVERNRGAISLAAADAVSEAVRLAGYPNDLIIRVQPDEGMSWRSERQSAGRHDEHQVGGARFLLQDRI